MALADAMRGKPGRGDIYRYLWDRYDELKPAWDDRIGDPDWNALAAQMVRDGVKARRGGKVTAGAVRVTWQRVIRDAEELAERRKRPAKLSRFQINDDAVQVIRAPERAATPSTPTGDTDARRSDAEPRGFRFDASKAAGKVGRYFRDDDSG